MSSKVNQIHSMWVIFNLKTTRIIDWFETRKDAREYKQWLNRNGNVYGLSAPQKYCRDY